jgi:hypothetical protein
MFGINKLKQRIQTLEQGQEGLRTRVWQLECKPKFKEGDIVNINYSHSGGPNSAILIDYQIAEVTFKSSYTNQYGYNNSCYIYTIHSCSENSVLNNVEEHRLILIRKKKKH